MPAARNLSFCGSPSRPREVVGVASPRSLTITRVQLGSARFLPSPSLGDRLTAGRQILALAIKVRILVPQLFKSAAYQMRQAVFTSSAVKRTFLFLTAASPCLGGYPLSKRPRPHRLAVRTPASHVGNTGSSPVGVTPDFACETRSAAAKRNDAHRLQAVSVSRLSTKSQSRKFSVRGVSDGSCARPRWSRVTALRGAGSRATI